MDGWMHVFGLDLEKTQTDTGGTSWGNKQFLYICLLCSCTDVDVPLQQLPACTFIYILWFNATIIQSRSDIVHKTPACSLTLEENHPVSSTWELNAHNFTLVCVLNADNWPQRQDTEDAILFWPLGGSRFNCFTVNVSSTVVAGQQTNVKRSSIRSLFINTIFS